MSNLFLLARTRAGLTQRQVAKRAGITASYLSQIETGQRTTMSASTYLRLTAELSLSAEEREALDLIFRQGTVGGAA
jgi:transcriptional regulator with XRE-family HTH domain